MCSTGHCDATLLHPLPSARQRVQNKRIYVYKNLEWMRWAQSGASQSYFHSHARTICCHFLFSHFLLLLFCLFFGYLFRTRWGTEHSEWSGNASDTDSRFPCSPERSTFNGNFNRILNDFSISLGASGVSGKYLHRSILPRFFYPISCATTFVIKFRNLFKAFRFFFGSSAFKSNYRNRDGAKER